MMNIMHETYGVMVYQEDVIKVAHLFAGLDLGEADVLRRGMSRKYRSGKNSIVQKISFSTTATAKDILRRLVPRYGDKWKVLLVIRLQKGTRPLSRSKATKAYTLKCTFRLNSWWL